VGTHTEFSNNMSISVNPEML